MNKLPVAAALGAGIWWLWSRSKGAAPAPDTRKPRRPPAPGTVADLSTAIVLDPDPIRDDILAGETVAGPLDLDEPIDMGLTPLPFAGRIYTDPETEIAAERYQETAAPPPREREPIAAFDTSSLLLGLPMLPGLTL